MKKVELMISTLMVLLLPILYFSVAIWRNVFAIDLTVLTLGMLWDVIWISALIWFGILILVLITSYALGYFRDVNGSTRAGMSGNGIALLFWIIAFFKGLFDVPIATFTLAIVWDILWIALLVVLLVVVFYYAIWYFLKISGRLPARFKK